MPPFTTQVRERDGRMGPARDEKHEPHGDSPIEVQSSLSDGKEVLLLDYEKVARQAVLWSRDMALMPNTRTLAGHLAVLARILTDEYFGCPTEHQAAEIMYRCLQRTVESK